MAKEKGKGKNELNLKAAEAEAKLFDGGDNKMEEKEEMEMELELDGDVVEEVESVKTEEMELELEDEIEDEIKADESSGMEFEVDGDELHEEMEDIVKAKVKEDTKAAEEQKSKRGPKPGSKREPKEPELDEDGKVKEPKATKSKELDLTHTNIVQREIKKGRLSAPQGRIERNVDGGYEMFISNGIIFSKDQNWISQGPVDIMHEGKFITTIKFADLANENGKFPAVHENGTKTEHEFVRVELHKPGRAKDVVELFSISEAKSKIKQREEILNKKIVKDQNEEEE